MNLAAQQDKLGNNVQFYFDHLPDTCFYLCDWRDNNVYSKEKIVDIRNGFIAFKTGKDFPDAFQIALFKGNNKDVIVVSNRECEAFACFTPTSFFYIYENNNWIEASKIILPRISTNLFYDDSSNSDLLDKYGYFRYDFILPQFGTTIKIELDICDYLQVDYPEVTDQQYDRLIDEKKSVNLVWDRHSNKFEIKNNTPTKK
ncbi:MAG: hypothetical protein AAFO07_20000 [Bacteroidota bacterium]